MYIFALAAFFFAGLESLALWKGWRNLEFVAKPAVMVCLFAWLALAGDLQGALLWFGLGILLSLAGDVALLSIDRFFTVGLAAFLLTHLAYLIGFNTPFPKSAAIWSIGIAIVIGLSAVRVMRPIVAGVRKKGQARLATPVILYGVVITLMLLSALLTLFRPEWKSTPALLVSAGAFLFYLSDIVLAWNRFVSPIRHGRLLNIGLYHLGQIAIITGVIWQFG
ncbi:MAG: lysoplasmalogenase [Chloroflexota bacterium]